MKRVILAAGLGTVVNGMVPMHHGRKAIPGQYIVVFKDHNNIRDGAHPDHAIFNSHMEALRSFMKGDSPGNEITHEFAIGHFRGYSIRATENTVRFIRQADDIISYVEEDQYMSAFDVQNNPPSWGLDRVSQRNLPLDSAYHYPTSAGSGVDMYTIDTGIYISHSDYAGRATWGYTANANASDDDLNGHGTHCSGTMAGTSYGIAKKANLIAVKVLGDLGFGSNSDVIAGVNWVAGRSGTKKVANMSLGGGASSALDVAVNQAVEGGTHIAAAAGNDNADACNYSPARADNVVCVGSTDSSDAKSSFSNYGSCVEIHAPGTSITSSWIGGTTASRTISGTSMAAPHVAGVMALYLGEGIEPTASALISASTKNIITGLPSSTVNYLLYSDASLTSQLA